MPGEMASRKRSRSATPEPIDIDSTHEDHGLHKPQTPKQRMYPRTRRLAARVVCRSKSSTDDNSESEEEEDDESKECFIESVTGAQDERILSDHEGLSDTSDSETEEYEAFLASGRKNIYTTPTHSADVSEDSEMKWRATQPHLGYLS